MTSEVYNSSFRSVPSYNGYTNKPTWLVEIWIDNLSHSYNRVVDMARELNVYELETFLQENIDELTESSTEEVAGLNRDLLNWAKAYVNWREIAENYWEVAHENDEEEE